MKKRIQLIDNEYIKEKKLSKCEIHTDLGDFCGTACMNPEDEKYESKFTGGYIAETRAIIKYKKEQIKHKKSQIKIMQNYYNTISSMKEIGRDSPAAKKAYRFIKELEKDIKSINKGIENANKNLNYYVSEKIKITDKYSK